MNYLKIKLKNLASDGIFQYTLLSLLAKSIILLAFINSTNAPKVDFSRIFYFSPPILLYICFIVVFLSFAYLFKNRGHAWYLIIINILVSIIIIADILYYRAFGSFISAHLLKQTANLDNLSDSIFSMMRPFDILFIIDVIPVIILLIKNKKVYRKTERSILSFVILIFLSLSYLTYLHYKIDVLKQKTRLSQVFKICWAPNQTMSNLSPIGYHIYDTYSYIKDSQPVVLNEKQKTEIKNWFETKKENIPDNKYKGLFKGKNLIVVQVESLENFVINQKINGQEITPNINKLLKNGLYFNNYHEQVYNGTSSDADLMTNTSVYPVRRGSTFFRYPYNTYNSLPKLMAQEGYSTTAIHPDKGSYWNWLPALKSIGFERCIDSSYFNHDELVGMGLSDGSYLKQVEPIIAKNQQPFYTFLVTLTSHAPFDIPKEYRELKIDKNLDGTKLGGYFQSINYTDKHIGLFIDKLDKDGLLDNSVVVIYGDHTGIHKFYQEEVNQIKPSESWWLDNHRQIPLIIYQKGITGEKLNTIGGQVDLLPTLCYLMGIDESKYIDTAMGKNLLKTNKNFTILADGKIVGNAKSEGEKQHALNGINIADKIIQSNFFKRK